MTRLSAIKDIMKGVTDEVVISSVGYCSRDVYAVKDRARNFYMMGSMGCELAFGIGISLKRPDLRVIVLSGDGSALMGLSTIQLLNALNIYHTHKFKHYILNNKCYETTGGQKTSFTLDIDSAIYSWVYKVNRSRKTNSRIPLTPKQISRRFENAIRE